MDVYRCVGLYMGACIDVRILPRTESLTMPEAVPASGRVRNFQIMWTRKDGFNDHVCIHICINICPLFCLQVYIYVFF